MECGSTDKRTYFGRWYLRITCPFGSEEVLVVSLFVEYQHLSEITGKMFLTDGKGSELDRYCS